MPAALLKFKLLWLGSTEHSNFKKIGWPKSYKLTSKLDVLHLNPWAAGGKECPPPCVDRSHAGPQSLVLIDVCGAVVVNVGAVFYKPGRS